MTKINALLVLCILVISLIPAQASAQACAPSVKSAIEEAAGKHFTADRDLIKGAIRTENVSVLNYACFTDGISASGIYYFTTAAPSAAANDSVQQYLSKGITKATADCVSASDLATLTSTHEEKFKTESFDTSFAADFINTAKASVAFTPHFDKIYPYKANEVECGTRIPSGVIAGTDNPEYFCSNPNCVNSGSACAPASGS